MSDELSGTLWLEGLFEEWQLAILFWRCKIGSSNGKNHDISKSAASILYSLETMRGSS